MHGTAFNVLMYSVLGSTLATKDVTFLLFVKSHIQFDCLVGICMASDLSLLKYGACHTWKMPVMLQFTLMF